MTKRENTGWMLIYIAIISWVANGVVGTILALHDIEAFKAMMIWAFGTLAVLLVGIFLAMPISMEDKES